MIVPSERHDLNRERHRLLAKSFTRRRARGTSAPCSDVVGERQLVEHEAQGVQRQIDELARLDAPSPRTARARVVGIAATQRDGGEVAFCRELGVAWISVAGNRLRRHPRSHAPGPHAAPHDVARVPRRPHLARGASMRRRHARRAAARLHANGRAAAHDPDGRRERGGGPACSSCRCRRRRCCSTTWPSATSRRRAS